jgi:alpha-1,2-mannosyltransferase
MTDHAPTGGVTAPSQAPAAAVRDDPSPHDRVIRLIVVVLVAGGLVTAMLWARFIAAGVGSGWALDHHDIELGRDLRAFAHAATLLLDGRIDDIYRPEAFIAVGAADFQNPPFYALLFVPLAQIPMPALWFVWAGASFAAIALSLRLLRVRHSFVLAVAVLFTAPLFTGLRFGQNEALSVLLLAAVYRLLEAGRARGAGAVAGLLAYKPHFLAGLGVWWLLERRRRPALAACAMVVATLVIGSWALLPGAWPAFVDRLSGISELYSGASPVVQFTSWHAIRALLPWMPDAAVTAMWLTWSIAALAAFTWFLQTARHHLPASFAAAVVFPLLVSPHVVVYDWALLIVPGALVWNAFPAQRTTWLGSIALIATAALIGAPTSALLGQLIGYRLPVAMIVLVATVAVCARAVLDELRAESPSTTVPAQAP